MNRRRFMKLFGAVAAAGAVPAIAGADAALAYAEKQPVQVEDAMRRLVDGCEDLRRPFVEFARQADATAFSAAKLEEAMRLIAQQSAIDLTPRYIVMSEAHARDIAKAFRIKVGKEAARISRTLEERILGTVGIPTGPFGEVDIAVSPFVPHDRAFIVPREAQPMFALRPPVVITDIEPGTPTKPHQVALFNRRGALAPPIHELGKR